MPFTMPAATRSVCGVRPDRDPRPSRSPKFVPLLLLQLVYKPLWLAVFAIPLFLKGQFPKYAVGTSVVFLTYIIGDLIAIPFAYLFSRKKSL